MLELDTIFLLMKKQIKLYFECYNFLSIHIKNNLITTISFKINQKRNLQYLNKTDVLNE